MKIQFYLCHNKPKIDRKYYNNNHGTSIVTKPNNPNQKNQKKFIGRPSLQIYLLITPKLVTQVCWVSRRYVQ
jgi:hypothetical protein